MSRKASGRQVGSSLHHSLLRMQGRAVAAPKSSPWKKQASRRVHGIREQHRQTAPRHHTPERAPTRAASTCSLTPWSCAARSRLAKSPSPRPVPSGQGSAGALSLLPAARPGRPERPCAPWERYRRAGGRTGRGGRGAPRAPRPGGPAAPQRGSPQPPTAPRNRPRRPAARSSQRRYLELSEVLAVHRAAGRRHTGKAEGAAATNRAGKAGRSGDGRALLGVRSCRAARSEVAVELRGGRAAPRGGSARRRPRAGPGVPPPPSNRRAGAERCGAVTLRGAAQGRAAGSDMWGRAGEWPSRRGERSCGMGCASPGPRGRPSSPRAGGRVARSSAPPRGPGPGAAPQHGRGGRTGRPCGSLRALRCGASGLTHRRERSGLRASLLLILWTPWTPLDSRGHWSLFLSPERGNFPSQRRKKDAIYFKRPFIFQFSVLFFGFVFFSPSEMFC